MRQPPTIHGERPGEDVERLPWYQFTLTDLLALVTAVPIWMGVVAAVQFIAFCLSYAWFGIDWHSDVRHFLIDSVGLPENFVCGYVTAAMMDLPAWVCYVAIAIVLGLVRWKWAFSIGVAFVISVFVWDLMWHYSIGVHDHINLRLVSLFGVALAASSFAVTRRIRGRWHVSARTTSPIAVGLTCLAIVALLGVSLFGWWLVDASRKARLEAQEMFDEANAR